MYISYQAKAGRLYLRSISFITLQPNEILTQTKIHNSSPVTVHSYYKNVKIISLLIAVNKEEILILIHITN